MATSTVRSPASGGSGGSVAAVAAHIERLSSTSTLARCSTRRFYRRIRRSGYPEVSVPAPGRRIRLCMKDLYHHDVWEMIERETRKFEMWEIATPDDPLFRKA